MLGGGRVGAAPGEDLAARTKEIFRNNCFECHGGLKTNAGVVILDSKGLLDKQKVVPGKPEASPLFDRITCQDGSVMPQPPQPRLSADEVDVVRRWIAAGAAAFPDDVPVKDPGNDKGLADKNIVGVDYILEAILKHVRSVPVDDRRFYRYFTISNLTKREQDVNRDALAKALNHLSLEPELVRPEPIDDDKTVFAVDIRKLGWQRKPFSVYKDGQSAGRSNLNFFDLLLLEYPYGIIYEDSDTFSHLAEEFLAPAAQVRPIVYVRADWFVSTATLPPLYNDLLELPLNVNDLEARLKVNAQEDIDEFVAERGGLSVSSVANNNRALERHLSSDGAYWKSFDYRSSVGPRNIFKDPVNLHPDAGELIFSLPNQLQGYFIINDKGARLDAADTQIVTDALAQDHTVRNGLSCMRCHDTGMKAVPDAMHAAVLAGPAVPGVFDKRQALQLYPEQKQLDADLKKDTDRFTAAMQQLLGKPPALTR